MPIIAKIPHELQALFGPILTDKFVDFLNSSFQIQKEDVITVVSDRFEKTLAQTASILRLEMADLRTEMAGVRTEMAELRSDMQAQMAELRSDMQSQMAELRTEFAELRADTREQIAELRTETNARIDAVRLEVAGLRSELKADIASIHREISAQTRWILAAAAALITLYPLVTRLMAKLIPLGP